jgi:DNA gyrase subunit B
MVKAKSNKNGYSEDDVEVLEGLDGVRRRPGMYMGEKGQHMVWQMLAEAVGNCNDEHLAGRNDYIEVVADTKVNSYIVADRGVGIPVGLHKKQKVSTLELVMTKLHAGAKFSNKAYAKPTSPSLLGRQASCTRYSLR